MIIGLTGLNGAGKTTVVEHLRKKNFIAISLSEVPHEMLRQEGKETTQENILAKENALQEEQGKGILVEMILNQMQDDLHYVIDNLRSSGDVEALKTRKDFVLISVEAPLEIRFERLLERKRKKEVSYEEILAFEREELENEEEDKEKLVAVARMAHIVLRNDQDLDVLYKKIDRMLADMSKKYILNSSSDDHFFIEIAQVTAKQSHCLKRRVGAVLVKDKRILAIGFDGTPIHINHCNEDGCSACKSETEKDSCLCNHAEENLIFQAAAYGLSVQDAKVYTTDSPCLRCTKAFLNAGVKEIVFNEKSPLDEMSYALLLQAKIRLQPKKMF